MAYTKTKETPNLGVPDASDDITGGIGWPGVAKIEEFLGAGGVLVTLGNGSASPSKAGSSGMSGAGAAASSRRARSSGSSSYGPDHPLAYGSPEVTSVFRSRDPVYDIARSERGERRPAVGHEAPGGGPGGREAEARRP